MAHPFPGNVRELHHVIERPVLMSTGAQIKARDVGLSTAGGDARGLEEMSLEEVEAYLIKKALARAVGNARQAAEALGLSRSAFYRRLRLDGEKFGVYVWCGAAVGRDHNVPLRGA